MSIYILSGSSMKSYVSYVLQDVIEKFIDLDFNPVALVYCDQGSNNYLFIKELIFNKDYPMIKIESKNIF